MRYLSSVLLTILALSSVVSGQEPVDYTLYDRVLKTHVDADGYVDYQGLKNHPDELNAFVRQLAQVDENTLKSSPERSQIAFWLNAYNALTLKLIVDHYPIKASFFRSLVYPKQSIRQIAGAWDKITFTVAGKPYTLDHIEHQILRKRFKEPRIHMALVCAARGCPPLRQEAYRGPRLDEQLDDQTRRFLQNPQKFRIDKPHRVVYLSSIFKWFGSDFIPVYGTTSKFQDFKPEERAVLNFISQYVTDDVRAFLLEGRFHLKYLKYDWTLNDTKLKPQNPVS